MKIKTPYYMIDEQPLKRNGEILARVREKSGAKILLALKCFSSHAVFPLLREYLDGTTSSSLYEVRLGAETFGKETQAYCVGYTDDDIKQVYKYASKIIFNSLSQLKRAPETNLPLGVRINPLVSYSHFDLANPARPFSRLGLTDRLSICEALEKVDGLMFHFNCENTDIENIKSNLSHISEKFDYALDNVSWVSLGGGMLLTEPRFPVVKFCDILRKFSEKHKVQVYLEPGEAVIRNAGELVTSVVDIVYNREHIAIVDASAEAHMLDLIIYRESPKIDHKRGKYTYHIAGRSCLAGDVFGQYSFNTPLQLGDKIHIKNAAGYSIVKKTWFNGLQMPSIVVKRLDGSLDVVREFTYKDFKYNLS